MNLGGRIWPMGGEELGWRGLIAQSTDLEALAAEAAKGPITLLPAARPA
jgi:tyrosyl-tRNA synthetase